jgi:hypothetical protein
MAVITTTINRRTAIMAGLASVVSIGALAAPVAAELGDGQVQQAIAAYEASRDEYWRPLPSDWRICEQADM